ncbi:hypothetical protein OG259_17810 [Streptomyces sp. NBC_00250]|uniref:hypothetical protein n=1 Tax=Streptomyces sp. NBC_00250 TaxID=2903641 RepID=UPI002E2E305B|nr:hypothetical protein [Streptomyces sp. NBC_00250]
MTPLVRRWPDRHPGPPPAPTRPDAPGTQFRRVGLTYPGPPPVQTPNPCELAVRHGEFVVMLSTVYSAVPRAERTPA